MNIEMLFEPLENIFSGLFSLGVNTYVLPVFHA
jgi:hypothetical protein